jgi:hypothetical protein
MPKNENIKDDLLKEEPTLPGGLSKEDREDIERAQAAQKRMFEARRTAPKGASVEQYYANQLDVLAARYVPESVPQKKEPGEQMKPGDWMRGATMRAVWNLPGDNKERHRQMVSDGWEPVPDERGAVVQSGGMILYKRPIELSRDRRRAMSQLSADRLKTTGKQVLAGAEEGVTEDVTKIIEGKLGRAQ